MGNMQLTAIVLMTLLTLKLLLLPVRVATDVVLNRARWLMVVSTALLGVQFLLQLSLGLRALGVTQAVMVNLIFFIPCSWLVSLAVLYLQQQGRISKVDKYMGLVVWIVILAILGIAASIDGKPLMTYSDELYHAEIISSCIYACMQGHYAYRQTTNLRAMSNALHNYFDRNQDSMLRWMQMSVVILVVLALMVPALIFIHSWWLAVFGAFFIFGLFYLVDSFCSYAVSSAPAKMREAERSEELAATAVHSEENEEEQRELMERVEYLVEQWLEKGKYLKNGMKLPNAAMSIGIPQYQLSAWLRNKNMKYSEWMTTLRIEEAKRILATHTDWSNETIAQHCGFNDRSYFHKKFKEVTGMSPADFQASLGMTNED